MANRWEKVETMADFIFWAPKSLQRWLQPRNLKMLAPWKKSYDNPRQCVKKQRHYFADKSAYSQSYSFSSSQIWIWELDHKEGWAPKNWCFWTVVLEKTLVSPLDCKEIQPVHPKGDQSWVFTGRTDVEAETQILWPPDVKSWLNGKDSDAGKDWGQVEKEVIEDEMVGWHHQPNGHGFVWTLGVGNGEGGLACCSFWGGKESDWLNWTKLNWYPRSSLLLLYRVRQRREQFGADPSHPLPK